MSAPFSSSSSSSSPPLRRHQRAMPPPPPQRPPSRPPPPPCPPPPPSRPPPPPSRPPPSRPDNLNAQRKIISVREKRTVEELELHVLQAVYLGHDSEMRRLLRYRPVKFNEIQESLLLHWAEWEGRWDALLILLKCGCRFTHHTMEAAVQRALRHNRLDFVRGVVTFLPDLHLPWTLQLDALTALSGSDHPSYVKDAARLLRVLPRCVDVGLLRHLRQKLTERLGGDIGDEGSRADTTKVFRRKLKLVCLIDCVVERLSSEKVTG